MPVSAAKQEAFEESIRLKNQFRSLDDDEVEFLDSVLESTRTKEAEIKKETTEQLDLFRRQQEEADKALLAEAADGSGANVVVGGGSVEEEQWVVSSKKRRRGKEKEVLKGVKLRKTSSAGESKTPQLDKRGSPTSPTSERATKALGAVPKDKGASTTDSMTAKSTTDGEGANSAATSGSPSDAGTVPAKQSAAVLGLGDYSSDDDE